METANRPAAVREAGPSRGPLLGALFGALLLSWAAGCGPEAGEAPAPEPAAEAAPPGDSAPGYRRVFLPFAEGAQPSRAAVGDLNGDGRADFVVCGTSPGEGVVRLYLATEEGEYGTRDLAVPPSPRDVVLADLDGDSHLDLATANTRAGNVTVFFGDGGGGFTPALRPLPLPYRPHALAAADVDGDGRIDLVGAGAGGQVAVFFGKGTRGFLTNTYLPAPTGPSDIAVADVDGDGDLDLAVPLSLDHEVAVYRNEGGRKFAPPRRLDAATRQPFSLALADLDRDGDLDLVTPDLHGEPIRIHPGAGDGSFGESLRLPGAVGVRYLRVADLDADGRPDIVATASAANRVLLYYGRGEGPFQGDGSGRFASPAPLEPGEGPQATALGDLNGDGLPDLVTSNRDSFDVTLFLSEPERRVALGGVNPPAERDPAAMAALAPDYEEALSAFRSGDLETARPLLERIVATGRELLVQGALVPDPQNAGWLRYHAALLVLVDLHRYRAGDPARARDLERDLAETAERYGYLRLAALEWLGVGEIEEQALGDRQAASAAYERVLRIGRQAEGLVAASPPPILLDAARQSLDRLHADEPGRSRSLSKIELPYPGGILVSANEIANFVIPHTAAYAKDPTPVVAQRAFSDAHPGTFRAAFAEYASVVTAFAFPGRFESPFVVAEQFLERYPGHVLAFVAQGHVLEYYHRTRREEDYAAELEKARRMAEEEGIELQVDFEKLDT